MFVLHFNRQNDLADHKLAHPGGQIYLNNTRASWLTMGRDKIWDNFLCLFYLYDPMHKVALSVAYS